MKDRELLKRINEITEREYKSLDDISHHSLMAIYATLLVQLLEEKGVNIQIFQCNPKEHT